MDAAERIRLWREIDSALAEILAGIAATEPAEPPPSDVVEVLAQVPGALIEVVAAALAGDVRRDVMTEMRARLAAVGVDLDRSADDFPERLARLRP